MPQRGIRGFKQSLRSARTQPSRRWLADYAQRRFSALGAWSNPRLQLRAPSPGSRHATHAYSGACRRGTVATASDELNQQGSHTSPHIDIWVTPACACSPYRLGAGRAVHRDLHCKLRNFRRCVCLSGNFPQSVQMASLTSSSNFATSNNRAQTRSRRRVTSFPTVDICNVRGSGLSPTAASYAFPRSRNGSQTRASSPHSLVKF